jgi:hypothetical protein
MRSWLGESAAALATSNVQARLMIGVNSSLVVVGPATEWQEVQI